MMLELLISILILLIIIIIVVVFQIFKNYNETTKRTIESKEENFDYFGNRTSHNKIIFLGDSITEQFPVFEFFPDINVLNRGIGGDTTDGVLKRLESNVISLNPSKVILMIGTNDLYYKKSVDYVLNNITKIIDTLNEKCKSLNLFVMSITPVGPPPSDYLKGVIAWAYQLFLNLLNRNEKIDKINNFLESNQEKHNYTYIDINSLLKNDKGKLAPEFTIEGLHLTTQAYVKITEKLKPIIS